MPPRTASYVPPVISPVRSSVAESAARSVALSYADAKLSHVQKNLGIESIESEAAARTKEEKEDRRYFWITFWHAVFASVSMIAALVSFKFAAFGITKVAFVFPLVSAPYTVRQRRKLNKKETLREKVNKIRLIINRLFVQNDRLSEENDKLKIQVQKLKGIEEHLAKILEKQGQDVDQFRRLVQENGRIQQKIKRLQKAQGMQDCVKIVLTSDRDRNSELDDVEIEMLVHKIRAHPDLSDRSSEELRSSLSGADRSIATVLSLTESVYRSAGIA